MSFFFFQLVVSRVHIKGPRRVNTHLISDKVRRTRWRKKAHLEERDDEVR